MRLLLLLCLVNFLAACQGEKPAPQKAATLVFPNETHFANVQQLTREGENSAEAYYSFDDQRVIFQSTRAPFACDQIFTMNADGSNVKVVSTGKGKTTCAYFFADGEHILYASTHAGGDSCPPPPSFDRGYVWALYPSFDIYMAKADGSELRPLTNTPGYDAEATISPDGTRIVFTSLRDGDLDLYAMNIDGSNVQRLTNDLGYDGGAFYSPDGAQIVYRAYHPQTAEEIADYHELLKENLIRPSKVELLIMDADGSNKRQITNNGAANFAPFFHPSGKKIIFCSNVSDTSSQRRNFDLFLINLDGSELEQVTHYEAFDGFPMFNKEGTKLIFCSNRNGARPRQTNVFVADWVD
ncbi:PD40 domain-containing protein [candidate division KSB1 bacterium]|nr:PD40 domain-containing protein [candidate division KSB1 bacterium]